MFFSLVILLFFSHLCFFKGFSLTLSLKKRMAAWVAQVSLPFFVIWGFLLFFLHWLAKRLSHLSPTFVKFEVIPMAYRMASSWEISSTDYFSPAPGDYWDNMKFHLESINFHLPFIYTGCPLHWKMGAPAFPKKSGIIFVLRPALLLPPV